MIDDCEQAEGEEVLTTSPGPSVMDTWLIAHWTMGRLTREQTADLSSETTLW